MDKKQAKNNNEKQKKTKKRLKKGQKLSGDVEDSWGNSMKSLFKLMNWIATNGVYRIYRYIPVWMVNTLGHLFGNLVLGRPRKVQAKVQKSFTAIYPDIPDKLKKRLSIGWAKYMGEFLLDTMFRLPLASDGPYDMFFEADHGPLKEALKKNKGVIVPTAHIGQILHAPAALFQHSDKIKTCSIVNITNVPMYEACNRKRFNNLTVYASTQFSHISERIESDLRNNYTFLTYHDYSSPSQLRVPMLESRFPYLIHTPQSHISLAKKTGAVILPAIPVPIGDGIGKTRFIYLDNRKIMEAVERYKDAPDKVFHGMVSIEINNVLYDQIIRYMHVWEEIMNFSTFRIRDKLIIPKYSSIIAVRSLIFQKMVQIIEGSFERFRDDEYLLKIIKEYDSIVELTISNEKERIINDQETIIDLSRCLGIEQLVRLLDWFSSRIEDSKIPNTIQKITELKGKIRNSPKKIW